MRILKALKADIMFQFKQGFYFVYIALTIAYMIVIGQLPTAMGRIAVPLVVFSDPSVVGFFFIGGIIMLEKIQGILQYIVVTPLRTKEYLLSKVISLAVLSEFAGFAIAFATYEGKFNMLLLFIAILLTSSIFTLYGFIVAAGCNTINQYFVKMVPYMLVLIIPCLLLIKYPYSIWLDLFPSVTGLKLIFGCFHGIGILTVGIYTIYLVVVNLILFKFVENFFERRLAYKGEI